MPLGVLGAGLAVMCALMFGVIRRLVAPLAGHTMLLPVAGGVMMGLVAVAFPLTLFSGEHEFSVELHDAEQLGGWLLLATAIVKLLTVATALSTGDTSRIGSSLTTDQAVGVSTPSERATRIW